jgi:AcrR family transcriptional regulator
VPPEQRREELLDAALRLIDEEGFAGATMDAVARGAGVTKPVIYDLFANRGELLRELLAREEERALGQIAKALPRLPIEDDPDVVLADGIMAFLEAVAASPSRWRLILQPVAGTPDVVRKHVDAQRRMLFEQVQGLLAWGIQQRGGPRGLDLELAAHGILAQGESAARLVLEDPERYPPERVGGFLTGLLAQLPRA